jgi:hypothetical protein
LSIIKSIYALEDTSINSTITEKAKTIHLILSRAVVALVVSSLGIKIISRPFFIVKERLQSKLRPACNKNLKFIGFVKYNIVVVIGTIPAFDTLRFHNYC